MGIFEAKHLLTLMFAHSGILDKFEFSRSGGIGRRAILRGWCSSGVRVRVPPSAFFNFLVIMTI